ncbi:hypothetical protein QCE73_26530 [Caballeronia sp. LZ029]|uniref:hypothetical protein n=1 Tax=Caballeronia sp. LZ029 TaxID=3038564 RepID=UPI002862056B|nr:hypothetical protein [Caballeronia sp. LZ029]MDR5746736.1 hypothetical protein [Caballeronia sp. LZ029]
MRFTTAADHEGLFACDADSVANLQTVLADCAASQTFTPDLWLDAGGVPVTPFRCFMRLLSAADVAAHARECIVRASTLRGKRWLAFAAISRLNAR